MGASISPSMAEVPGDCASAATSGPAALEALEFDLLLEALRRHFGFDFRGYEQEPLRRKLRALMLQHGLATVSALQERALHDAGAGAALLRALSQAPLAMFDEPCHYAGLRAVFERCLPTAPLPKIWLAECAGAEEAWSVAILLHERKLLERTGIFATSANEQVVLEAASVLQAAFPAARLAAYEQHYRRSGGKACFADYFHVADGRATLLPQLRSRITWAHHNLVTDASFNEFELIVCRRALADFGPALRRRALQLFHDSLAGFGVIGTDQRWSEQEAAAWRSLAPIAPAPGASSWYQRLS